MKIRLLLISICLSLAAPLPFAQTRAAQKIQEFGFRSCDATTAYLDSLLHHLLEDTGTRAYVISYDGYHTASDGKRQVVVKEWSLPRQYFFKRYISDRRKGTPKEVYVGGMKTILDYGRIDETRIIYVNGGHREKYSAEFWAVPEGAKFPEPTPTVNPEDKKFKGLKVIRKPILCIEGEGYSSLPV